MFSLDLTENTLCFHYKKQYVNVVYKNNCCFFKYYTTHINGLYKIMHNFNVKTCCDMYVVTIRSQTTKQASLSTGRSDISAILCIAAVLFLSRPTLTWIWIKIPSSNLIFLVFIFVSVSGCHKHVKIKAKDSNSSLVYFSPCAPVLPDSVSNKVNNLYITNTFLFQFQILGYIVHPHFITRNAVERHRNPF